VFNLIIQSGGAVGGTVNQITLNTVNVEWFHILNTVITLLQEPLTSCRIDLLSVIMYSLSTVCALEVIDKCINESNH